MLEELNCLNVNQTSANQRSYTGTISLKEKVS